MLSDYLDYARNLVRAKAPVLCDVEAVEPDLDCRLAFVDMDMRRLIRFVAIEIEAESMLAMNGWHIGFLVVGRGNEIQLQHMH